jgi:hypothetical protein
MNYSNLKHAKANHNPQKNGRGPGSGRGGTSQEDIKVQIKIGYSRKTGLKVDRCHFRVRSAQIWI